MPKFKTLYDLCIDTLILKSADIEDLSGIPFEPYILDLLNNLFSYKTSHMAIPMTRGKKPWKFTSIQNLLAKIADAHGAKLRQPQYVSFGSLRLTVGGEDQSLLDKFPRILSQTGGSPQFITQLDLSMSWFNDEDVPLLKFMVNLMVLDLSATKVTDDGVSHICRFTQLPQDNNNNNNNNSNSRVGLPYLETLSLAYNISVTDRSLKYLRQVTTLWGIDLSTTYVNKQVATTVLHECNYICNDETPPLNRRAPTPAASTRAWHKEDDRSVMKCDVHAMRQYERKNLCPVHPLTLITHQSPFPYNRWNPQHPMNHEDERKGVAATYNEHMYLLLTNDELYGRTRYIDHDPDTELWWKKKQRSLQPLVFTRPSSVETISTESNVGKKRSYGNMADSGGGGITKVSQRPVMSAKQSQTASSFIENFQW